ncbi:zinc ribbon domain-containing protein [Candidatus Margulisiibacteriota bacterium]
MQCPKCRTENTKNAKFCENCGQALLKVIASNKSKRTCPECGELSAAEDKFCNSCGALIKKSPAKKTVSTSYKNILPRDERYRLARQQALKLAQDPPAKISTSPIIYLGEKIT